jgi:hypothetical protein
VQNRASVPALGECPVDHVCVSFGAHKNNGLTQCEHGIDISKESQFASIVLACINPQLFYYVQYLGRDEAKQMVSCIESLENRHHASDSTYQKFRPFFNENLVSSCDHSGCILDNLRWKCGREEE